MKYVCVCVCERERENKGGNEKNFQEQSTTRNQEK